MSLREITWGAVGIALGLVVPVLFHALGLGPVFLPMFLPLLAVGLLMGPLVAGLVGFATPLLSAMLTGMPPLAPPVAIAMAVEGAALGILASWLYRIRHWNIYLAAAVAVLAQRTAMVGMAMALAPLFGLPGRLAALGMLLEGLPGVALLILAVPLLVRYLERAIRRQANAT